MFPKWEHGILNRASYLGEDPEVPFGKGSGFRGCAQGMVYRGEESQLERPAGHQNWYRTAGILRNNRVVFNIKGNTYRLVVAVKYEFQVVYIRFIGTHAEYDKIKARRGLT